MRHLLLLVAAFAATSALAQSTADVKNYETAYAKAKKALAAKPKDAKLRQAFVVAGDRYATASMTSPDLPPRVKYRQALRVYREVLKVDPKNREAKNNSGMIESIYRQMGRPVPQ